MDMTSYIIGRKSAGGGSDITIDDVIAITGELDNLDTTDKSNLVNAINEVASSSSDAITFVDTSPFYLSGHKKGIYYLTAQPTNVYYDDTYNAAHSISPFDGLLYLLKDVDDTIQDKETFGVYLSYVSGWEEVRLLIRDTSGSFANVGYRTNSTLNSVHIATADTNQTISGLKTFSTLPETSIAPTTNNQLANKKYVDDAVAGAGGGEQIPTLVLDNPYTFVSGGSVTDSNMLSFFSTRITEMLTETPKKGLILIEYNNSGKSELWCCTENVSSQSTQYNFYLVNTEVKNANYRYALAVRGAWANDVFTCSHIMTVQDSYSFVLSNQVLTKTNNDSYTPTGNYNPATKKYVDDSIAAAITTTLGGSY